MCCRSNININDVLGDYSLTLIDALDTLAGTILPCIFSFHSMPCRHVNINVLLFNGVMGNTSEFKHTVQLVLDHVSFDKPTTVQVFEATIR